MRLQCGDQTVAVIEDLLAALIGVGVEVLRVLGQGAHALGDGSGLLPLLAQQASMRALISFPCSSPS